LGENNSNKLTAERGQSSEANAMPNAPPSSGGGGFDGASLCLLFLLWVDSMITSACGPDGFVRVTMVHQPIE
jgi:hypothetical protein